VVIVLVAGRIPHRARQLGLRDQAGRNQNASESGLPARKRRKNRTGLRRRGGAALSVGCFSSGATPLENCNTSTRLQQLRRGDQSEAAQLQFRKNLIAGSSVAS